MITGQRIPGSAVAKPPQPHNGLPETRQRPAAARGAAAPLAHSSFATNWASSLGTSSVPR
jgi:hypothetical protein